MDKITRFLKFVPDTGSRKDCLYISRTKQSLITTLQLYYKVDMYKDGDRYRLEGFMGNYDLVFTLG